MIYSMAVDNFSPDFWKKEWKDENTLFHMATVDRCLEKYLPLVTKNDDTKKLKVLVPLCGKSVDMKWLADGGHQVIGVEFVPQAVQEFYTEQQLAFTTDKRDNFTVFKSSSEKHNVLIYCGDLYDFTVSHEGQFDLIWDRGSLVSINPPDRNKYLDHITKLLKPCCACLLQSVEYDTSKYQPLPNCIPEDEVRNLYENQYDVKLLEKEQMTEPQFLMKYYLITMKASRSH